MQMRQQLHSQRSAKNRFHRLKNVLFSPCGKRNRGFPLAEEAAAVMACLSVNGQNVSCSIVWRRESWKHARFMSLRCP